MDKIVEGFANAEVFGHFTKKERLELAQLATKRLLHKGDILCFQGDSWTFVLYIASGTLRSMLSAPDGRTYVVYQWKEGEEFWSHTLLDGDPMPSTLEAAQDAIVYQWPGETVITFLLRNQEAVRALLRRQTRLVRRRRENIYDLAFNPVAGRLAKLIVSKFSSTERSTMRRDLTLEEMAAMVASSPEVVCRILYQFQDNGFLHIDRASITLKNLHALEDLVVED